MQELYTTAATANANAMLNEGLFVRWKDWSTRKEMKGQIVAFSSRSGVRRETKERYIEPVAIVMAEHRLHVLAVNDKLHVHTADPVTGEINKEL
jgi:hypothetical protein